MAYGTDLFQQKRATPYMGPTKAPTVATTLPTPTPLPAPPPKSGPAPGISGGVVGGGGGYQSLARDPLNQGPSLPISTSGKPLNPATVVKTPGFTNPVPGSSSPTFVPGVSQRQVDLLGSLGLRKTADQMSAGTAQNAYKTAYKKSISNR